jgi:ribosomal protein S18 acetylase RimI-like enzyme
MNISLRLMEQNESDRKVWTEMLLDYYPPLVDKLDESWDRAFYGPYNGGAEWTLAEVDSQVVGFSACILHPTAFSLGQIVYLSDLYVEPSFRRMGVASALLEDVIDGAKLLGREKVYWFTQHENAAAQALYRKYARNDFTKFHINL